MYTRKIAVIKAYFTKHRAIYINKVYNTIRQARFF